MTGHRAEAGFSAVELLITLFIAAIFLFAGYQLYTFVFANGTESSQKAEASRIAYRYLRTTHDTTVTTTPCTTPTTPVNNQPITGTSLNQATVTVTVSCPFTSGSAQKIRLVKSTVEYRGPNETKVVSHAQYAY